MSTKPALLGGPPAFISPLPFVRPALPPLASLECALREMFHEGQLTKGRRLEAFENAIAQHLGVKHAVGVSSCTSGLMLAHRALQMEGEVIVPSFTFMATISSMVWAGLTPVFVDVEAGSGNIDPTLIEAAITPRTTAIVGVHLFGNPAAIAELEEIANRRGLALIFDAAHGFGARYQGRPVGSQGDAQVFSLSPTKLLVAGEGGIVSTNDDAVAERIRLGREYGNDGTYDSLFPGLNARMAEFNAILGLESLSLLEGVARRRNAIADRYRHQFAATPGIRLMDVLPGNRCSYKDFSIEIDPHEFGLNRDEVSVAISAENIDTRKYYSPPAHRQTAYRDVAFDERSLPNTNRLADNSLSLPMGTHVSDGDVDLIVSTLHRLHQAAPQVRAACTPAVAAV